MLDYMYVPRMLKKKDVAGLIKLLGSKAIADRNCAAEALGKLGGAEATNALIQALLREAQPAPVSWMISALKEIGHPVVKPLLSTIIENPVYQSTHLYEALAAIGSTAVPVIEKILATETGVERIRAITAMSYVGGDSAEEILLKILNENDAEQSRAASEGLKRMDWHPAADEHSVAMMISIGNWTTLAEMGSPGVSALCSELANREKRTEGERLFIASLLGKTGGAEAVSALKSAFGRERGTLQVGIGKALAQAGGAEIADYFIAELANGNDATAIVLGELKEPHAFKPLINEFAKRPGSLQIRDALEKFARIPDIDPLTLQEYKTLKSRLDQEAANLSNPIWVLENMPISNPSAAGARKYTRREFLEKYPSIETYSSGNLLADFCMVYHGLVEYCTVERTGPDSYEIIREWHEDTDW